jgi:hypothetical protein
MSKIAKINFVRVLNDDHDVKMVIDIDGTRIAEFLLNDNQVDQLAFEMVELYNTERKEIEVIDIQTL